LDILLIILNIIILSLLCAFLYKLQKKHVSFTNRAFIALGLGIVLGLAIQYLYGVSSNITKQTTDWYGIVGNGYLQLLQMVVMPLILVSIISSFIKMKVTNNVGKISAHVLGVLLGTTAVSAVIGILAALVFGLNGKSLVSSGIKAVQDEEVTEGIKAVQHLSFPDQLLSLLPANPIADLSGSRPTSTIAIVIFAAIAGIAYLGVKKRLPEQADTFAKMIGAIYAVIMQIVTLILRLTPYGVMALMANMMATSDFGAIAELGTFVIACYAAVIVMFLIHLLMLSSAKLNPILYLKKALPALIFGFTSRSLPATLPLTSKVQIEKLGVPEGIANFAATLGTSIGQNGCAGIFPAMIVVMSAPLAGVNPLDPKFLIATVLVVVVGSLGVSGMGGGAQFAALIDLTMLNLPIPLVGLLFSIDPIIDMVRTSLNVSDSMLAGIFASRATVELEKKAFNTPEASLKELHV